MVVGGGEVTNRLSLKYTLKDLQKMKSELDIKQPDQEVSTPLEF